MSLSFLLPLQGSVKGRDEGLRQPEGEDQLGARHEQLGDEALKEGAEALVASHVGQDAETALRVVEVAVLYAGLDNVEGSRDNQRGGGTGNRGDKVLEPGGLVVVLELEQELLGKSRTTEELDTQLARARENAML